jgi:MFS family permease
MEEKNNTLTLTHARDHVDVTKRNYFLIFFDTIFFFNAMTFLSINAIITYYLYELGATTFDIGLANALVSIGTIVSQPYFAKKVVNLSYKKNAFTKYLLIQRLLFLLFVLMVPLFSKSYPGLMLTIFFVCWTVFNFFVGAYGPFFISLLAKLVAVQQRGRLRGYAGGIANLLALGSAFLASVIMKEVVYPYNYTILFGIGVFLLLLDALIFAFMKEEPDQVTPLDMSYFQYFKSIPDTMSITPAFRRIVFGFCFMVLSQVSLAYYTLYAVRTYDIASSEVALFTAITGAANIAGSIVFGIIADKFSNRAVLVISSACACLAGIIIFGYDGLYGVYAAFALSTLSASGYLVSGGILIIEHVPRDRLPMCISVNNVLTLIVSAVMTLCSSFFIDLVSFSALFVITAAAAFVGCVIIYTVKPAPLTLVEDGLIQQQ